VNFSPALKAWIQLVSLVVGSGIGVGMTAFLGGSNWVVALICGIGTGATNVYHALSESPRDKAARTTAPFPPHP
jgi:F0F1-type ATP synthase assembly protein I